MELRYVPKLKDCNLSNHIVPILPFLLHFDAPDLESVFREFSHHTANYPCLLRPPITPLAQFPFPYSICVYPVQC